MKCPKCGALMMQVDLPELTETNALITWECTACHYRIQLPLKKSKNAFI